MKKTFLKSALLAAATIGMLAGNGYAAQLTGGISLNGFTYTPLDTNNNSTSLADADKIAFPDTPLNMEVGSGSGSFGLIPDGTDGKINDFTFNPFEAATPLWLFSYEDVDYWFNLTSAHITIQNSSSLTLDGFGYLNATGYEPTYGTWTFTANTAREVTSSWSASNAASPVPEPATMLLFGTGLAGLAGVARRKKK